MAPESTRITLMRLSFDSRDEAKAWVIHNQFGRRNLAPFVRGELALVLEPLLKEKAKVNQAKVGENYGVGKKLSTILPEAIDTQKEIAAAANLSEGTMHKVRVIAEKVDENPPVTRLYSYQVPTTKKRILPCPLS